MNTLKTINIENIKKLLNEKEIKFTPKLDMYLLLIKKKLKDIKD